MSPAEIESLLAVETGRARRALVWERAAPLAWPPLAIVGVYLAAALAGAWDHAPPVAHAAAGGCVAAALVLAGWRAARSFRWPGVAEARARLEEDCPAAERPLTALEDRPASGDATALALWRLHQQRMTARAAALKAARARPALALSDRYRLRYVALAAVVGAAVLAGADAPRRLLTALGPPWGALLGDRELAFEAWATPPAYTGAAPIYLTDRRGGAPVKAPEGSVVTVRVTGARGAPVLQRRDREGARKVAFVRVGEEAWEARLTLRASGHVRVLRFGERARWRFDVIPDEAPKALFAQAPNRGRSARIDFQWSGQDDYGVARAMLKLTVVDPGPGLKPDPVDEVPLDVTAADPRRVEARAELDLTRHAFAGLAVDVQVVAIDALGQRGESERQRIVLPERVFEDPVARAAIEARREIVRERRGYGAAPRLRALTLRDLQRAPEVATDDALSRLTRAPAGIKRAAALIDALTLYPEGLFESAAAYLGVRRARAQLDVARTNPQAQIAAEILWDAALALETGDLGDAARRLAEARKNLADALKRGASQEELQKLMQELRESVDDYLKARVAEALQQGDSAGRQAEDQVSLSEQDLKAMMDAIEDLSELGAREQAQQMLDQLAETLANLQMQMGEAGDGQDGGPGAQGAGQGSGEQAGEGAGGIAGLMDQQRRLRDQTFQEGQRGEPGQAGDGKGRGASLGERQRSLADQLSRSQEGLAQGSEAAREAIRRAERAMRTAEQALRQGDFEGAQQAQADAIAQLREGAQSLAAERMQADQMSLDPLGRRMDGVGGATGDGGVSVPDAAARARARAILEEIRRRAARGEATPEERDYLERLLERF